MCASNGQLAAAARRVPRPPDDAALRHAPPPCQSTQWMAVLFVALFVLVSVPQIVINTQGRCARRRGGGQQGLRTATAAAVNTRPGPIPCTGRRARVSSRGRRALANGRDMQNASIHL